MYEFIARLLVATLAAMTFTIIGSSTVRAAPRRSVLADVRTAQAIVARERTTPQRCGHQLTYCSTVAAVVGIPGTGRMEVVRFRWSERRFVAGRYAFERVGVAKGLNTHYGVRVRDQRGRLIDHGHAVLAWKAPIRRPDGGWASVTYTPYSAALHRSEVARAGDAYLGVIIHRARELLRRHGVQSRAVSRRYVTNVIPAMTTEAIALVEKIDHAEFLACGGRPPCIRQLVGAVHVAFAVNRERAYRYATSHAGARGFMQFMSGTWGMVRRKYPTARLSPFHNGSSNQIESVMAAILLNDYNLTLLEGAHVQALLRRPEVLTLYSAAAYNGNPQWAIDAIASCGHHWMHPRRCGQLRSETDVYLRKVQLVWPMVRS